MFHVLIIPSWFSSAKTPNVAPFIQDQITILKKHYRVGVLYPMFSGNFFDLNIFLKRYNIYTINKIPVYSCIVKPIVPFFRNIQYKYLLKHSNILFKKYINRYGKPDLLHAHSVLPGGIIGMEISKKYNIPLILTEHSSAILSDKVNFQEKKMIDKVYNYALTTILVSTYQRSALLKNKYSFRKDIVLGNIINPSFFSQTNNLEKSTDEFNCISIGHLNKNKNFELIVFSASLIKLKNINRIIKFKIIGKGEDKEYLEKLIKKMNVEDIVTVDNNNTRENIINELKKSDLLISTSKIETFGLVIAEAIAMGVPAIVTPSGGPNDIINENNGIILKNFEIKNFAQKILEVADNPNRFRKDEMREEILNKFGEGKYLSVISEIYKTAIKEQSTL